MRYARLKFAFMFLLIVAGIVVLLPTFRLHVMMPGQERALAARRAQATTPEAVKTWMEDSAKLQEQKTALYSQRIVSLGLDLVGGMDLVLEVDKSKLTEEQAAQASERALAVIRNRIDQFGVFEPNIQATSGGRILVQLPGVDRDRALNIIKQQAFLTMQLVEDQNKAYDALKSIDDFLARKQPGDTASKTTAAAQDSGILAPDSAVSTGTEEGDGSLTGLLQPSDERADLTIAARDTGVFHRLLADGRESWPQGFVFRYGPVESDNRGRFVRVYLLKEQAELEGSKLRRAETSIYNGAEMSQANTWVVDFELDREGAAQFARATSRNVGRRLAIVLDGVVRSAPQIKEPIPNGRGQITTGDRRGDEAKDLATVLNSGALPAPVKVVEERSVSASLGRDSIRRGVMAALIGCLAVIVFMVVYYSIGGALADFALLFNLFLLLAVLAVFRGTLTLPGLAGIALTIGMAVDANVLVFERVREELRAGKTNMAAVDTGYARAFVTIIDSNLTTIITAIALYFVGAGPIRGFAITLTAGLVINVITAVFFTRWIFDWWLSRFSVKTLRV